MPALPLLGIAALGGLVARAEPDPCGVSEPAARDLAALVVGAPGDSDCDGVGDDVDPVFDGPITVPVEEPWTDGVYSWTAAFDLTSTGVGTATATLRIQLRGQRDAAREAAWEAVIEDTWSREGLTLDVIFQDDAQRAHTAIEVRPGEGWASAETWFEGDDGLVVAHEVGHQLGLLDEYPDPAVPGRFVGPEDSIMRSVGRGARSYPWHQQTVRGSFRCP